MAKETVSADKLKTFSDKYSSSIAALAKTDSKICLPTMENLEKLALAQADIGRAFDYDKVTAFSKYIGPVFKSEARLTDETLGLLVAAKAQAPDATFQERTAFEKAGKKLESAAKKEKEKNAAIRYKAKMAAEGEVAEVAEVAEDAEIAEVADMGEPAMRQRNRVELVTVQDQQAAAIGGLVDRLAADGNAAEIHAGELAEDLVVIAGDVNDAGTPLGALQQPPDHVVMRSGPVEFLLQPPAIDHVADQIHGLAVDMVEKVDQHLGVAAARAEMDVGNPDGAIPTPLMTLGLRGRGCARHEIQDGGVFVQRTIHRNAGHRHRRSPRLALCLSCLSSVTSTSQIGDRRAAFR